ANSGLRTDIGALDKGVYWAALLVVLLVGSLAKVVPVLLVSRLTGRIKNAQGRLVRYPWRECLTLGVLMNTRGLVALIVLNIGLSNQILGPRVFTIMVIFSILTTFITPPSLFYLYERR